MPAQTACRICGRALGLARRGNGVQLEPAVLRPTYHPPREHGDIYRCGACGTMQQSSLPCGAALRDLYRAVSDPEFLTEELGRRHTARRLLDLLAEYVPHGRLLDVGCGYGLLLDEAQRRGYDADGLELWTEAARYARETLHLHVRNEAFEDAQLEEQSYDAVLLVDILEHFDDPVNALARARSLLVPGGVLLIVTPDPSSRTVRLVGARWWAYLPSHVCLIPRSTLHRLLRAQGFAMVREAPSRHSFTPGYWLRGLAERSGRIASATARLVARLPAGVLLTASLGDERVTLARREGAWTDGPRTE
jgi:2-polyprenyl-3-methyl-5-hydroxy-6-metoxy-1,4-benzoquinol methylase